MLDLERTTRAWLYALSADGRPEIARVADLHVGRTAFECTRRSGEHASGHGHHRRTMRCHSVSGQLRSRFKRQDVSVLISQLRVRGVDVLHQAANLEARRRYAVHVPVVWDVQSQHDACW
jgi:hypothetical protein